MRILLIWLASGVSLALFVAFTSIGPVVYSMGWRHGVHATDLALAVVLGATSSWLTWHAVRPGGADRPRSADA